MNNESLCWNCSKPLGFYENPCPHCGATNPNVDMQKAIKESGLPVRHKGN